MTEEKRVMTDQAASLVLEGMEDVLEAMIQDFTQMEGLSQVVLRMETLISRINSLKWTLRKRNNGGDA